MALQVKENPVVCKQHLIKRKNMSYLGKKEKEYLYKRVETDFVNANIGTKESIDNIWIQFKTSACGAMGKLVYVDEDGQSQTLSWCYEDGQLSISNHEVELSLHTEPCGMLAIIHGYMNANKPIQSQHPNSTHNLYEDDDMLVQAKLSPSSLNPKEETKCIDALKVFLFGIDEHE